jgi:hypothetical protein
MDLIHLVEAQCLALLWNIELYPIIFIVLLYRDTLWQSVIIYLV